MEKQDKPLSEPRCHRCERPLDHIAYYFPASVAAGYGWGEAPAFLCYRCPTEDERTFWHGVLRQNAEVEEMHDLEAVKSEHEEER